MRTPPRLYATMPSERSRVMITVVCGRVIALRLANSAWLTVSVIYPLSSLAQWPRISSPKCNKVSSMGRRPTRFLPDSASRKRLRSTLAVKAGFLKQAVQILCRGFYHAGRCLCTRAGAQRELPKLAKTEFPEHLPRLDSLHNRLTSVGSTLTEGATKGAPEAVQVADRFHLLCSSRQPRNGHSSRSASLE